ncbi:hypothetical protein [Polynucleobacter paneuropaeus]|uniref:hypothetical protein n=1 Tax=Polynucleobacter paneuropaeus TaxID=2527775 RepID=UPI001BFD8F22|nr:hypothetical protein [Polynucleobacter paneuropaeus]MBT8527560.1 hypothetical protein [Polynucleobacter paneuropaeus]QWD55273.1 hypothetical protein C2750_05925 [Polynucleobacter paneuropaeus]
MNKVYRLQFDFCDNGTVEVSEGGAPRKEKPEMFAAISFALRAMADVLDQDKKKLSQG